MKTRNLYLTALLLLALNEPAPAQSEAGASNGFQSSLNKIMDDFAKSKESLKPIYDELIRAMWLYGSDITMDMNAEFEGDNYGRVEFSVGSGINTSPIWIREGDHEGSLHLEFDWQYNMASMRMESSAFDTKAGFFGFPASKSNESIDMTVYLDAQGYWYVPVENYYVRVHPIDDIQNGMAKMLNVSLEAVVETQVLDQLAYLAYLNLDLDAGSDWIKNYLSPEFIGSYTEQTLKPLLEKLAQLQAMKLNGLPTFVHFPYFFSPTLARSQFSPNEQTGSWRGQDNCTKMTLASGYLVVFDRYGRLIHLRDTDGDTADYSYDKEVTLDPPPVEIKDFSKIMKISKN